MAGYGFDSIGIWLSTIDLHLKTADPKTAMNLILLARNLPLNNTNALAVFESYPEIKLNYSGFILPPIHFSIIEQIKRRLKFKFRKKKYKSKIVNDAILKVCTR